MPREPFPFATRPVLWLLAVLQYGSHYPDKNGAVKPLELTHARYLHKRTHYGIVGDMELNIFNKRQKAQAEKRRDRVLRLRAAGKTWKEIGRILRVSRQRAQQLGKEQ